MIQVNELLYSRGPTGFQLQILKWSVEPGRQVALIGPSGCGKTTLLHLLSGALLPDSGSVVVADQSLNRLGDAERRNFRARKIGFVFQDFELLEYLSVAENIRLPYLISSAMTFDQTANLRLQALASQTGIADKLKRRPSELSQGERQRVAICRALIGSPSILLADEPTGSLDPDTAKQVMQLLIQQSRLQSATLIVVTHDHSLLSQFDQVVDLGALVAGPANGHMSEVQSK